MAEYHVRLLESAIRELGKLDKLTRHRVAERNSTCNRPS